MQTRYIRMSNPAGEVARVKRTKNTYGQYNDEADTLGWNNSTINKLSTTYKILDASTNAEVACTGDAANKSVYLDDPVFNKLYKIDLTTCINENNRETLNLFSIVKYNMKTSPGVYNFKVKAYIKIVDNDNIEYVYGENSNLTVYNYIFRSEFCHTRSVKSAHLFFTITPDIDGAVMDIDSLQFYQIMLARHYNEANTKEFKLKELAISKKTEIITKADDNTNKYYSTSVIEQSFTKDDSMNDANSNSVTKRTGNNGKLLDLTFRATENGIAQTAMLADFTKKFKQLNISFDSTSSYASIKLYEYIPATDSYNSIGTVSPNTGYQTIVIPATVDTRHLQMRFVISTALADKTYDFRNVKINAFYRYISDLETRNSTGTTQGTLANIVDLTNVDFKGFTGSFAGNTATITAANEDVPCWFRLYGFQYRDISKLSMSFICSASSYIAVYGIRLDGTSGFIGTIINSPDVANINTQLLDIPAGYEQIYFQFELANVQNTAYVVSNILMSVEYRDTYAAPAAFSTILTADVTETADARVPYKVISVKTAGNIDLINNTISGSLDGSATPAEVVQIVPNNSNNINNFNDYISMIIDLGGSNTVDKIIPYFEYEDTTYYKYRLEVSGDGNNWFTVFDNIKMAHEELPVLIPLTNAGNYTLYEALHKIIIPTWFTYPADFSNRRKVRYIKVMSLTADEFAVNRETMEPLTTERHLSISELRVYSGADDLTYSIIDYVENEGRNPLALMRNGQFEHKLTEGAYFVNSNRDQNDVSFTVDLGGINYITRIDIFAGNNKTWYKYRVLISTDKVNWEQIKENVTAPVRAYEG